MHNRSHTATPPHLPPSPSVGDLKKRWNDNRTSVKRGKTAPVMVAFATILLLKALFMNNEEVVSPFVSQKDEDIECRQSKLALVDSSTYTYEPSSIEQYIIDHTKSLGYETTGTDLANTCDIIFDDTLPIHKDLQQYFTDLKRYNKLLRKIQPLDDLRLKFNSEREKQQACEATKLHKRGLSGIFKRDQVSNSSSVGIFEPLLPTMRSHKICTDFESNLLAMDYLVHDFYSMCLHLQKDSRLIFIDMGASLDFHDDLHGEMPAIYIHSIYSKFGFKFDHIYAYEVNPKYPSKVFEAIPDELLSSWHWINVGVDARKCAKMNPFTMLADSFTPEDFIVVKIDIDTPVVEAALVEQLREDPALLQLVDQFYFEHHVHQLELSIPWAATMEGSVGGSLELMQDLRRKGIATHYWP
jgi:hypothetical protein